MNALDIYYRYGEDLANAAYKIIDASDNDGHVSFMKDIHKFQEFLMLT